jgi:hypothetical protein
MNRIPPSDHNGKPNNINIFKDLLRRKSLLERLAPVLEELLWMAHGSKASVRRKKALPNYCYKILGTLQKKHFKVLPPVDSFGPGIENFDWEALGRVIGLGLRCLRFEELESDKILAREIPLDVETTKLDGLICSASWLREQEAALQETENHFVKGAEELQAAALGCQRSAYQQGAAPMAQLNAGIQKGIEGFLDESGQLASEHARENIYWFLLIVWPEVQEMQQSGQKTRKDFCEWIQPFATAGLVSICGLDQLSDVCDDIGLKFKGRGAPRKK